MVRLGAIAVGTAALQAEALRTRPRTDKVDLSSYSFERFIKDFDRDYVANSKEYHHRAGVFAASLAQINAQNSIKERTWTAGVHRFMDWNQDERRALHGYKPSRKHGHMAALQTEKGSKNNVKVQLNASFHWGDSVTNDNISPDFRNQGNCGSCWAISAVEAAEAQLAKSGQGTDRLSAQALVDCVPNPQHCGGSGGCDGATGELAYSYMKDYGIPFESDLEYTGKTEDCPSIASSNWGGERRVKVDGWTHLQSNKAEPLMQSLVQNGPTVVAVDANDWFDYDNGIFNGCSKDAELGHAVLAKGYGEEAGKKYWTIQNSWGADWGEHGSIRLTRHEDEEQWCGMDKKPQEGEGCDGGPPEIEVCGMCGILYDPVIPDGVHVEGGYNAPIAPAVPTMPAPQKVDPTTAAPRKSLVEFNAMLNTPLSENDVDVASEGMSSDEQKELQSVLR